MALQFPLHILCRFIFTADPRGKLKLWRFSEPFPANSHCSVGSSDVCLVAEFVSSFSRRIMCLDASLEEEVYIHFNFFDFAESI